MTLSKTQGFYFLAPDAVFLLAECEDANKRAIFSFGRVSIAVGQFFVKKKKNLVMKLRNSSARQSLFDLTFLEVAYRFDI